MHCTTARKHENVLDTSIRTGEVYVMNVKKVLSRYHISLVVTPVIAAFVASSTLLINVIIPWFFEFFDKETSVRLSQSVELTSVYGVALGTMFVFILVATLFAANIPLRKNRRDPPPAATVLMFIWGAWIRTPAVSVSWTNS